MIEYTMFTGDNSHTKTLQQALTANYGPANDFILDYRRGQTVSSTILRCLVFLKLMRSQGNDDQAFWALAAMSALEYQFPDPEKAPAAYLEVAINSFNNIVGRWDESSCGGGLKWQIYTENAYGYNYKNSISNGCTFALGARLARYTGNQTYADWAVKIYDWTKKVGLITDVFEVFDGVDDKTNCDKVADKTQWSYNNAMFLHGSAFMYDYTNGDSTWKERTSGFLNHAQTLFFSPFENSTNVMYEWACETGESGRHCNLDQQSFKAYLARFMAKTAILAPFTKDTITSYLKASAIGAAKSCSGGPDGTTCGSKWYQAAWDGTTGVGQQLSALEVTQALLMIKKGTLPVKNSGSKPQPLSTVTLQPSSTATNTPIPAPPSAIPSSTKTSSHTVSLASSAPAPPKYGGSVPASSSVTPVPVKSFADTSSTTALPVHVSSSVRPGSQVGEKPSSTSCAQSRGSCTCTPSVIKTVYVAPSSSCTPSVTETVYVPLSKTAAPIVPVIPTPVVPGLPVNSSAPRPSPSPSAPLEFQGVAVSMRATGASILGATVVVIIAGLL
jgi:mannan endo-1,6-alpha-mannosidase